MSVYEALEEAACQRLRAVLLTSMTTIAGLTPLLFETSRQAQFLIPMAVSIAFGLAFATLLILLVIPSMLSIYEDARIWLSSDSGETVIDS
jgi:multidrug efflux pump subunit AcrB